MFINLVNAHAALLLQVLQSTYKSHVGIFVAASSFHPLEVVQMWCYFVIRGKLHNFFVVPFPRISCFAYHFDERNAIIE